MERYINSTSNVKKPPLTLINPDDIERGIYEDIPDRGHALVREQKILNAINEKKKEKIYASCNLPKSSSKTSKLSNFPIR